MFFYMLPVIMKMELIERRRKMERIKQITRGTGKVIIALFCGVLMPILIWVAFGAAIKQGIQRKLTHTTREILATA